MTSPTVRGEDTRPVALLRDVAERAARIGAGVVASAPRPTDVDEKAAGDYVTEVDRASEAAIRAFLASETPEVPMLGEESGGRGIGDAPLYWVVDPLDGTRNFVLGFPVVGVSVATVSRTLGADGVERRRPVAGAVTAPFLDLEFSAALGHGAWAGRQRLQVSRRPLHESVLATGFPFRNKDLLPRYEAALRAVLREVEDVRRAGAAALDLAWVAAGVFDGHFELGLSVWDVAAGALLVSEAGGAVTDWDGGDGYLTGDILAGSPAAHAALLRMVGGVDLATASPSA
jgi:myo-inositol-1(or 4)-monophosphatase